MNENVRLKHVPTSKTGDVIDDRPSVIRRRTPHVANAERPAQKQTQGT
jgi:hypothetical protein